MTRPYDGQIQLLRVFPAIPVDKVYEDQGVVDDDSGESQKPDQGYKGQGVVADQQSHHDTQSNKGDGDHYYKGLGKRVKLKGKYKKYEKERHNGCLAKLHK